MVCLNCDHKRPKASTASATPHPQPENEDYRSKNGFNFVSNTDDIDDQELDITYRHRENKGSNKWRFVEQDDEGKDRLHNGSGFVDFPILGGRSEFSRDAEKREKWKLQMLEKSNDGRADHDSVADYDDNFSSMQRRSYFLASDDESDEEIAEWFGRKKSIQSVPGKEQPD